MLPFFSAYSPLFSHKKPFIRQFAAESFAYLLRKIPKKNLEKNLTYFFSQVTKASKNAVQGEKDVLELVKKILREENSVNVFEEGEGEEEEEEEGEGEEENKSEGEKRDENMDVDNEESKGAEMALDTQPGLVLDDARKVNHCIHGTTQLLFHAMKVTFFCRRDYVPLCHLRSPSLSPSCFSSDR